MSRGLTVVLACSMLFLPPRVLLSQRPDPYESVVAWAQEAQARNDFPAAVGFYRKAVTLRPEIAELRANLGLMYYQTGELNQAASSLRQSLRLNPQLFVPNLFLGLDYLKLKRFEEAVPYLKKAANLRPSDVQAQLGLGQAYAGSGDTRLAIGSYLRATSLDSRNADAWYRLGMHSLEHVEADARVLLNRYKESGYVYALIADNFSEQGALIQAADAYRKALGCSASPPGTHASYAFVLLRQHDFSAALRELNAELASNPGSLLVKLGVARLHVEEGAAGQAAKEIEQIWNIDAGFLRAYASQLKVGLPQAKHAELQQALEAEQAGGNLPIEALAAFQTNSLAEPQEGTARLKKANGTAAGLYAGGKYRPCADLLSSKLRMLPTSELRLLAICSYFTGDYQHSLQAAQKLAARIVTEAEGLYWETRSAQKIATQALGRASQLDSGSPTFHVLLGDLYRQRKFFPDAAQEYQKVLAVAPNDVGALFGLSLALLADNKLDQAFDVAHTALKNNSDDPELNAVMGEILCARNDFSGAEPYLKKSLNTKPEYVSHVHALLGSVYSKTNRTQEAILELKLALGDDKDGHIHYQIARLYLKIGDRDSAKRELELSKRLRSEGLNRAAVAMQQTDLDSESNSTY
jgi:tetratricopeptide (TPR) repeat protein